MIFVFIEIGTDFENLKILYHISHSDNCMHIYLVIILRYLQ
jgi:hypothetical protein